MYLADELAGTEQHLRNFLVGRFGGPLRYFEECAHPQQPRMHQSLPRHRILGSRQMVRALDEADLPPDADALLREFFGAVASSLINTPHRWH